MPLSFVVPLLSLALTHCHLLSLVVTRCFTRCHSLSLPVPLVVTRCTTLYHSLSFVVTRCTTRCHSLSLVDIRCHLLYHSLPLVFRKLYLLIRGWNPVFFVTFNSILKHIFPESFIEFPQVVQKIWRISLSILAIFINFPSFFGFFDIILLKRN